MSETTTQNGTPAGTDVNTDVSQLDPELVKQLLALKAKDDERKEKLAKAAAERKRTNARGTMPDGTTERNPVQAYLAALGELLANWTEMYQDAPAEMIRRMNEQLIPSIVATSNTPSVQMAAAEDTRRHDYMSWKAPHRAKAPQANPANSTK